MYKEKPRIKAAEWQAPNPYTQSAMASLHHCPHIYMCPLTACVGSYLWHKQSMAATDPFLISNLPATQCPDACLHSAALTFDREDLQIMYPADRELVSNLICPEAEIDAVQSLEGFQYRHVVSKEIHQDVLQHDCKLPELFNRGLIRTIVSLETRLRHI